jgi:hypothetical protein
MVITCFASNRYRTDIDVLIRHVNALPAASRRKLLLATAAALHMGVVRYRPESRVGAVKVLVALYPQSKNFLGEWLRRSDAAAFDVHFSIFCFLDAIRQERRELLEWVHRYLRDVRVESAHAAWMAGDLLGDHWPLGLSLAALTDVARNGRFNAGRAGALDGIEMAAKRLSRTDPRRRALLRVLRQVQASDRSKFIKSRAAALIRALSGR